MGLPTPPSGQARRLLETTWLMANGSLRWPVFAELDRRLYSSDDIQVLDVIRVMPPGFLYGVGPNSLVPPGDTQEIGLTVAGIAACPNTSEILSVFVEFIQVATVTEKAWLPPPSDPAMLPTLTDADFAAHAHALPAAGRDHLLQLLFLIIKTERNGWAGLSSNPETGQWTVTLSRQIRDFANVRDINDYWSRRYKPWESGHAAPRPTTPATAVPTPPAGSNSRSHETTNRSAAGTTDTVEGRLAGTDRGTVGGPGASRGEDGPASAFAGASGVQLGSGNVQVNYFSSDPARTGSSGTRLTPASGVAGSLSRGHAFISYVREDSGEVDALQRMLEAAGIPVWRDTSSLWPGEDWRAKIRGAISRDALVFIACFSSHSAARQQSYMNEELLLAIEQLRRRRPDVPWLIPVCFDDCDVPDFELGAGRTLASIHRVDLFGASRDRAAERLVAAVRRLLRPPSVSIAEPPDSELTVDHRVPASSIRNDSDRAAWLINEAERIALTISGKRGKYEALAEVAGAWATSDPDHAERIAQSIPNDGDRVQALTSIATVVAATDSHFAGQLIADAERIAGSIPAEDLAQEFALTDIATALAAIDPDKAESVAESIWDDEWKRRALAHVAAIRARTDPDRAGRIAQSVIRDPTDNRWLAEVATMLAATNPDAAERIAQSIADGDLKVKVLVHVMAAVAAIDPDRAVRLITDAETIALSITSDQAKASALASIAQAAAAADPDRAARLITDAETIARSITSDQAKAGVLEDVTRALAATDPNRAVRMAQSITVAHWKAVALAYAAKAVSDTDLDRAARLIADAERIAWAIPSEGWADFALDRIVNVLASRGLPTL